MNSSDKEKLKLAAALKAATSTPSSTPDAASASPPSSDYIAIGNHREPLPIPATAQHHCLVLDRGGGVFVIVTCVRWIPDAPTHTDFYEMWRLQTLWRRIARCVARSGTELLAMFEARDMADCHAEIVIYQPLGLSAREFVPAIPIFSHNSEPPYRLPEDSDYTKWIPRGPDRLDAERRPALQDRLDEHKITVNIDEFFRATDQLGVGNIEKAALDEFNRLLADRIKLLEHLAQPAPSLSKQKIAEAQQSLPPSSSPQDRPKLPKM